MKNDFSQSSRWSNYARANSDFPNARAAEIDLMLAKTAPQPGGSILDFGCGDGLLTAGLARAVGNQGSVLAVDPSAGMLEALKTTRPADCVRTYLLTGPELPAEDQSIDAVTSLANFHHVPDKIRQFKEFARVLKPGGRLIIGDVADNTNIQRYFDGTVDAVSSTGHRHRFLDEVDTGFICRETGFEMLSWDLHAVPWVFPDAANCASFLHLIHDATCDAETCLDHAKVDLGYHEDSDHFLLHWKLFYFVGRKA